MVVLYRKYRPQKISEIDNTFVREKLGQILNSDNIPHAFLFTGPKGTGKTSSARIVAKSLNCLKNGGKGEPCDKCASCVSIINGNNLDVIEMDAASNRGIDEIRELRDKIKLAPAGASFKVFIIDEVHMLTNEAFNALLKTLEEPPAHAVFILATTNPEKLPETILSRCTRIEFGRAKTEDLIVSLKRAAKGEKKEIEEEALKEIALRSEGAYRDAHKLLEEIFVAAADKPITLDLVQKTLGKTQTSAELFAWVNPPNAQKGLEMVQKLIEKGTDLKFTLETMLNLLHAELLSRYGIKNELTRRSDVTSELLLTDVRIEQLKLLIQLLSKASLELKTAVIPSLPLELVIVEWIENFDVSSGLGVLPLDSYINKNTPSARVTPSPAETRHLPENETELQNQKWENLLEVVKPYNHSVAGLLRSCKMGKLDNDVLEIEVFYKFHYDKLSESKTYEILQKAAREVWGKEIQVKPILKEKKGA